MIRTIHEEAMGTDRTYRDDFWAQRLRLEGRLGNDCRFRRREPSGVLQPQNVGTYGVRDGR